MSFLYPRVISVKRPTAASGVGNLGHGGPSIASEVLVVDGVSASIQLASSGRNSNMGALPGDSPGPLKWTIYISGADAQSSPLIEERDVIYDDLGRRFQVAGYEPESTGGRIDVVRLIV